MQHQIRYLLIIIPEGIIQLKNSKKIILPGVGSFDWAINLLDKSGMRNTLDKLVLESKIPVLGICVGMQLLADKGFENGECIGLGWIEGTVEKFEKNNNNQRIPHIGWNEVNFEKETSIFAGVESGEDFYFVHSYHFVCKNSTHIIGTTPYCGEFVSAVKKNNIYGVQFHPEKSQEPGFSLLRNFLSIA